MLLLIIDFELSKSLRKNIIKISNSAKKSIYKVYMW